ncbi:hypothetical protein BG003_011802, partial [Podila horticola]
MNFGLTNRESATRSFDDLLKSSRIPSKRRTFLKSKFSKFQVHYAEQFWAKYSLRLNSERTAQRLALAAQDTAVEEAEAAYAALHLSVALVPLGQKDYALFVECLLVEYHNLWFVKHPRNAFDDEAAGLPKTPRNKSPSPTSIPTESLDSPPEVYADGQEKNPFQACNYDDENEEDGSSADAGEENDILLPDNTDQVFRFSAMLDGIDVTIGFQSLFTAVRKKTVYIHDIDQALARSGVILLTKEGTKIQKLHFGEKTLVQMREKALAKWQDTEAMAGRNQTLEDHGYDRTKSLKHISDSAPLDSKYQKLWTFLMTAVQEYPEPDSTKGYSESTIESTTGSGRSRNGSRSQKEPDLALEIKDGLNKTICEVGVGDVTSHAHKGHKKKNAKDLVRVGLSLKDALDFIQDEYGAHDAVLVGWQVIGQIMAIYLMFKCGKLYMMVHVRDVTIPDNLTELGTISTQIKIWNDLGATVEQGLSPIFEAIASGKGQVIGTVGSLGSTHARIETTRTPEFETFLSR